MPVPEYVLGTQAMRQIKSLVRQEMLEVTQTLRRKLRTVSGGELLYLAYTGAGGIPARAGVTPGRASVTLARFDADNDIETASDDDGDAVTVTAYNVASAAVAANVYVQLKQESVTGRLIVDFEDCGS